MIILLRSRENRHGIKQPSASHEGPGDLGMNQAKVDDRERNLEKWWFERSSDDWIPLKLTPYQRHKAGDLTPPSRGRNIVKSLVVHSK